MRALEARKLPNSPCTAGLAEAGVVGFGAFGIACLVEVVPHPVEAGAHLQEHQVPLAGRGTGTRRVVLHEAVEQHAQRLQIGDGAAAVDIVVELHRVFRRVCSQIVERTLHGMHIHINRRMLGAATHQALQVQRLIRRGQGGVRSQRQQDGEQVFFHDIPCHGLNTIR